MSESESALAVSFEEDIPFATAKAAHEGTSHVPDNRARQERASYSAEAVIRRTAMTKSRNPGLVMQLEGRSAGLLREYLHFKAQAEAGGTVDLLPSEFARYRPRSTRVRCAEGYLELQIVLGGECLIRLRPAPHVAMDLQQALDLALTQAGDYELRHISRATSRTSAAYCRSELLAVRARLSSRYQPRALCRTG
jgi:hypothetical protein